MLLWGEKSFCGLWGRNGKVRPGIFPWGGLCCLAVGKLLLEQLVDVFIESRVFPKHHFRDFAIWVDDDFCGVAFDGV